MTKEELDTIKENVYMRCEVATIAKIGITPSDKTNLKLIDEVTKLNNILDELEKYLDGRYNEWKDSDNDIIRESAYEDLRILDYLKELKQDK